MINGTNFITREEHRHLSERVLSLAERQAVTHALLEETKRRGEKQEMILQEIRQSISEEREERKRRDHMREKERANREREAEKQAINAERRFRKIIYTASVVGPAVFSAVTHFLAKFLGF